MKAHYFNRNGEQIIDIVKVRPEDAAFFERNNIKVSMEDLSGIGIIVYGCPYDDMSEESEVIVFANNQKFEDAMTELVNECKQAFGVE